MARYAYMRLDTMDPDTTRQAALLDGIGDFDKIFVDRAIKEHTHHAKNDKPQLAKALEILSPGDVLYAGAADRVCGQIKEFIELIKRVKASGAEFVCLDISLDTRSASSVQTVKALQVLSDIERTTMSGRKKSGIVAARNNGRRIGRPPVMLPAGFRDICREWAQGRISGVEAIRRSGLKSTSFYKKAAELGFTR